jgi:hypothetical protein
MKDFFLSDISNKYIHFLKKKKFYLDYIKLNTKEYEYFNGLIENINNIYSEIKNDIVINNNKITLHSSKVIQKNNKNNHPKIIHILKKIYDNNKDFFNHLTSNLPQRQKNEFIDFLKNIDINKELLMDWFNINGITIVNNLTHFLETNPNLLNEIETIDLYGSFISLDIQKDIENNFEFIYIYSFKYKDYSVKSTFITNKISLYPNFLYSLHIRALIWCSVNNKKKTEFKSWLTKIKKKLPNKHSYPIGSKNVNTGSTYRGNLHSINIWRGEEIKKVLIHEMGHSLEIEFGPPFYNTKINTEYNILLKYIIEIFNIPKNTEIRIYEAYNEIWALIINIIFTLIEYKHNHKDINLIEYFIYCLNIENSFSSFQAAKIIYHFDFDSFENFCSQEGFSDSDRSTSKYKQASSILSYYIIKSSLLYNINLFMEFCLSNNTVDKLKIKFNTLTFLEFKKLITKCLFDSNYIKHINFILNKMKHIQKKNNEIYSTLRMTVIEN